MHLLTIRKAGTCFGLETKYMLKIAELNEGKLEIFMGNKNMMIRIKS